MQATRASALLILGLASAFSAAQSIHDVVVQGLVYKHPLESKVRVEPDVRYKSAGGRELALSIYSPPDAKNAPIVVFINGVGDFPGGAPVRTWGQYTTWPRFMAANGYVSFCFDARNDNLQEDIRDAIKFVRDNAAKFGADKDRWGIWACSANVGQGLPLAMSPDVDLDCAVFYYGGGPQNTPPIRPDLPVLMVRAGLDNANTNNSIARVVQLATDARAPWTVLTLPNSHHAFDCLDNQPESYYGIQQTVDFFDRHLKSLPGEAAAQNEAQNALAFWFGQEWGKAATAYEAFSKKHPEDKIARLRHGVALVNAGQVEQGLPILESMLAHAEEVPEVHLHMAQALQRANRNEEAEKHFALYIKDRQVNWFLLAQIGTLQLTLNKVDAGIETLTRSIAINPAPVTHYNLACGYAKKGEKVKALENLEAAVRLGYANKTEMSNDPDLQSVREEERFKKLLESMP
jgi:dienelactone hydrolase